MKRTIITCLACVALLGGAVPAGADGKDKPRVFRMTVSPAGEPQIALKYWFIPRAHEQKTGNAALLYYRMLDRINGKDDAKTLDQWLKTAPDKLPAAKVRRMLNKYSTLLKEMELATRRDHCNWALPYREEGFNIILPPANKFRHLHKVLALRARIEIAEGKFDQAAKTMQTGFTFARHQADGRLLIGGLVGAAMAETMFLQVQAFSEAPGAPNLYWVLTTLGRPTVNIRKGLLSEADSLYLGFPALGTMKDKPITAEQWHTCLALFFNMSKPTEKKLAGTALGIKLYPHARKYLAAKGLTSRQIEAMPVSQAVATYMVETFERLSTEQFKWLFLPYHQAHAGIKRTEAALSRSRVDPNMRGFPLALMLPALGRAYFQQARLDRRTAALRIVESIRLHVAANDGKLPAKLTDITVVPVPTNPVTGKPFGYKVSGRTFTLTADAPSDMRLSDTDRYEVTLTTK